MCYYGVPAASSAMVHVRDSDGDGEAGFFVVVAAQHCFGAKIIWREQCAERYLREFKIKIQN